LNGWCFLREAISYVEFRLEIQQDSKTQNLYPVKPCSFCFTGRDRLVRLGRTNRRSDMAAQAGNRPKGLMEGVD